MALGPVHRLTLPLVPLLVAWLVAVPVLWTLGVDTRSLRIADRTILVPLWFLPVYLLVVALTPATIWLWHRFGWGSVACGLGLAFGVDALTVAAANEVLGVANSVVVCGRRRNA